MLPEEQELSRLEAQQADLQEQVTSTELVLETTKTETAQFQQRYYQTVGKLYARLDELGVKLNKRRKSPIGLIYYGILCPQVVHIPMFLHHATWLT
jgi:hypothetical protein